MPKLNEHGLALNQQKFADAYLALMSATAAYQKLHPKAAYATAEKEAKRYMKMPAVRAYIAAQRSVASAEATCTLADHLEALAALRDRAARRGDFSAAVKAEENRGKASGHYIDRSESGRPGDFQQMTDEQLEKALRDTHVAIERARTPAAAAVAGAGTAPKGAAT